MKRSINKAAVLGAGVMGATIAGHLANVGIPTYLLDIVPPTLNADEEKAGLTLDSPKVRNRFAVNGIANLLKAKPAPLYIPENARLLTPGNFEDNLNWLSECDLVIEVVLERLDIKQSLFEKVEKNWKPGSIIASNTSGLSINKMCEGRSAECKQHFIGMHFFNPPRYMRLLEVIPGNETLPEVTDFVKDFCERTLGKGVVVCKDTPNFVANRIGVFGACSVVKAMLEFGLGIDEVDEITGRVMGHPKSASFRTNDMVGLDVMLHVARNVYDVAEDPREKAIFEPVEFLQKMLENKLLGDKTGQGFYKKVKTATGRETLVLDYNTLEYRPKAKCTLESLTAAKAAKSPADKLKALITGTDKGAQFAWKVTKQQLLYAANLLGIIADDIQSIDQAIKWGFNWDFGPFESWDLLGVEWIVDRLKGEGEKIPKVVEDLLSSGKTSFYQEKDGVRYIFNQNTKASAAEKFGENVILFEPLKKQNKVIKSNSDASLIDIGDGVACLEFHSKSNAITGDLGDMMNFSVEEVEKNFEGLVIANYGQHFSVGANILLVMMYAEGKQWKELDKMVSDFQNVNMRLKFCKKPVVAAPHGMALGGGCEIVMHSNKVAVCAESYIGLVEVGVGLVPGGGGVKELAFRAAETIPPSPGSVKTGGTNSVQPMINRAFENISMARVSTSGPEAVSLGFFRANDTRIITNRDNLVGEAKKLALETAKDFRPALPKTMAALGAPGEAAIRVGIETMVWGKYISKHDALIAGKVAYILTGGGVTAGTMVTEQNLLDLEREAFLSLLGEQKTIERIRHMLMTNKPLRN